MNCSLYFCIIFYYFLKIAIAWNPIDERLFASADNEGNIIYWQTESLRIFLINLNSIIYNLAKIIRWPFVRSQKIVKLLFMI